MQLRAELLAVNINRYQFATLLYAPKLPAVARRCFLHVGADLVNGATKFR